MVLYQISVMQQKRESQLMLLGMLYL